MTSVFKVFPRRPFWKALSFDDLDLSFSFFFFRPYSQGQQIRKVTFKKEAKKKENATAASALVRVFFSNICLVYQKNDL